MAQLNSSAVNIPIRDIHLPDVVSWWPLAIGWWLVFASIVLLIIGVILFSLRHKKRRYKRRAETEFKKVVADYRQVLDPIVYVKNLSLFLRQTAMHFYSREQVAGLTGNSWLQFLDQTKSTKKSKSLESNSTLSFQSDIGKLLLSTPYNPTSPIESSHAEQLTSLVRLWVAALPVARHHKLKRAE